jgi:hypothetical protein
MATLSAGSSTSVTVAAGSILHAAGIGEVNIRPGMVERVSGIGEYGPYDTTTSINIRAIGSVIYWQEEVDNEEGIPYAPPVELYAFPFNTEGAQAAIDAISNGGSAGTVIFSGVDYDFTSGGVAMKAGVSYIATTPLITTTGDVPDSAMFANGGGTRLINGPGVYSFTWNNVDQASLPAANLASTGLLGISLYGLCSFGGAGLLSAGAVNTMGLISCKLDQLFFYDATDWGIKLDNFMQLTIGDIRGRNTVRGGGIRYGCTLGSRAASPGAPLLIPGNTLWNGNTFIFNSNNGARGIEFFGKTTTADNQLNELTNKGRWQVNRFGSGAVTMSLAFVNGSATVTIADANHYAQIIEGGWFGFSGSAPGGFNTIDPYVVVFKDDATQTIRLATSMNAFGTTGLSSTSTASFNATYGGPAGLAINFDALSLMTVADLGFQDLELFGNVCSIYSRRSRQTKLQIGELRASDHNGTFVVRDGHLGIEAHAMAGIGRCTTDSNARINIKNITGCTRSMTTTTTLPMTADEHEMVYLYNNAAGKQWTLGAGQPPDYRFKIHQMGAGVATVSLSGTTCTGPLATTGAGTSLEVWTVPNSLNAYYSKLTA